MSVRTFITLTLTIQFVVTTARGQGATPAGIPTPAPQAKATSPKPDSPVDSVIELVKSGMSEGLIIKHLQQAGKPVHLSPADMLKLQKANVSENIIAVMMDPATPPPALSPSPVVAAPEAPASAALSPPTVAVPPAPAPVAAESQPLLTLPVEPSPPPPAADVVTLPSGTEITIRTIDAVDSKKDHLNTEYAASLDGPLPKDGVPVVPAKSTAILRLTEVSQAGKLTGSTSLSLRLVAITINGQRIPVETGDVVSKSASKGKNTALRGLIGGAAGATIGALAGGATGAAIGAAAGAGAGTGSAIFSQKVVKVPSETRLTFKLTKPMAIN
jgi:hypothetical protein